MWLCRDLRLEKELDPRDGRQNLRHNSTPVDDRHYVGHDEEGEEKTSGRAQATLSGHRKRGYHGTVECDGWYIEVH